MEEKFKIVVEDTPINNMNTNNITKPFEPICDQKSSNSESDSKDLIVRLDRWLWAARFFKTSALARKAIEEGYVLYNNTIAKPFMEVQLDSIVKVKQYNVEKVVKITGLSTRRRNTKEVSELFIELRSENIYNNYYSQIIFSDKRKNSHPKQTIRYLRKSAGKQNRRAGE